MAKRVTIMIDDELDRKIRERQVRMMLERNRMYSLSEAVNDILAGGVMRFWEMLWVGGGVVGLSLGGCRAVIYHSVTGSVHDSPAPLSGS